jgi:hypothetical protein
MKRKTTPFKFDLFAAQNNTLNPANQVPGRNPAAGIIMVLASNS